LSRAYIVRRVVSIRSTSAGSRSLWAAAEDCRENRHHDASTMGETERRTFREFFKLPELSGIENLCLFLYLVAFDDPAPELCSGG